MRLTLLSALAILAAAQTNLSAPAKTKVDFEKDIQPLLAEKCYSCHGIEIQQAGLRLDSRQPALRVVQQSIEIRQAARDHLLEGRAVLPCHDRRIVEARQSLGRHADLITQTQTLDQHADDQPAQDQQVPEQDRDTARDTPRLKPPH